MVQVTALRNWRQQSWTPQNPCSKREPVRLRGHYLWRMRRRIRRRTLRCAKLDCQSRSLSEQMEQETSNDFCLTWSTSPVHRTTCFRHIPMSYRSRERKLILSLTCGHYLYIKSASPHQINARIEVCTYKFEAWSGSCNEVEDYTVHSTARVGDPIVSWPLVCFKKKYE